MQNTNDPKMLNWWAQYIESTGDMESAFKIYQKAEDFFSQVITSSIILLDKFY